MEPRRARDRLITTRRDKGEKTNDDSNRQHRTIRRRVAFYLSSERDGISKGWLKTSEKGHINSRMDAWEKKTHENAFYGTVLEVESGDRS